MAKAQRKRWPKDLWWVGPMTVEGSGKNELLVTVGPHRLWHWSFGLWLWRNLECDPTWLKPVGVLWAWWIMLREGETNEATKILDGAGCCDCGCDCGAEGED